MSITEENNDLKQIVEDLSFFDGYVESLRQELQEFDKKGYFEYKDFDWTLEKKLKINYQEVKIIIKRLFEKKLFMNLVINYIKSMSREEQPSYELTDVYKELKEKGLV